MTVPVFVSELQSYELGSDISNGVRQYHKQTGLGGLQVTHRLLVREGSVFNASVAREHSRFNFWAFTPAGKQFWLCAVRLQQTVIVCAV